MRVLMATYWRFPHVGGINTYVEALTSGLRSLGHQVDVLAHDPGGRHFYLTDGSFRINETPMRWDARRRVWAFCQSRAPGTPLFIRHHEVDRYAMELAATHLNLARYDAIHTQDVIATRALARVRPRKVPVIATIHGSLLHESQFDARLPKVRRRYLALEEAVGLRSADRVITPSRWLRDAFIEDYHLAPDRVKAIHTGLDIDRFRAEAARRPRSPSARDGRHIILCPARYSRIKGQDHLLTALALLSRRRRDFVCWLAGSGARRRSLEEQARHLRLGGRVAFLGPRDDVPALISLADVVVLPSLLEGGVPYAVQEAQLAGKPVVASRVSGLPEIVDDGKTGLLVRRRRPAELAEALDRLLNDESLRLSLGARAQAWAEGRWDFKRMTRETLEVYNEVLRA